MIEWVKSHAQWIAGGIIAILVAFYLLTHRGGSAAAGPGVVSFPPAGGGGGGGGPPAEPPVTVTPTTPALPYSPDFGILAAIKDDALKALYENEYNLEVQINQATLAGNNSLLATLQGMLGDVQQQITNYKPATSTPGPTPNPTSPSVSLADLLGWQNTWFTGAVHDFNSWVQDAPSVLKGTFTTAQLQAIYNYYQQEAKAGYHYPSTAALQAELNGWLANPSTIPTGTVTVPTSFTRGTSK